ncbi:hypothetical protein Lser_V15G02243 [Lactuca serriola]|uniref:DUF7138 domain-containing protein n=1 Tax=Lactuca sativa TaxID=4236 RepID=A0A9R1WRU2_LACSA|nr:hypothetical protein LSAT_V11C100023420 [Lactuca sativa]
MEEEDDAAAAKNAVFPVVLFDGERETDVGNVKIHEDLLFKEFQMKLSQMIGISYNNLTTYLVDSRKSKISPERRKILITGKVNFSVIIRERNCYFLVVLKRSRRDRRRKPSHQSDLDFRLAPDDLSRIHWNQLDINDAQMSGYGPYYYDERFHDLLIQRENYMNMILNSRYGFDSPLNMNFPKIEEVYPKVQSSRALCEDCTAAEKQGKTAEFHLCVYDEVILDGFRSPAGPVSRRR